MKLHILFGWLFTGLTTLYTLTGFSQNITVDIAPAASRYSVNQTLYITVKGGQAGTTYTLSALESSTGTALSSVTVSNGQGGNTVTWASGQTEATFSVKFLAGSEGEDRVLQVSNADQSELGQSGALTIIPAPVMTIATSSPTYSEDQSVTLTVTGGIPGTEYVVQLYEGDPVNGTDLSAVFTPFTGDGGINTVVWSATTTSAQYIVRFDEGSKGQNRVLVVGDLDLTHLAVSERFSIITCPITVNIAASPSTVVPPGGSVTLTASGAASYTWSTGASGSAITVNSVTSTAAYSVTGVSGLCSATASIQVAPLSLTVSSPILSSPLVLSTTNCPVSFTGQGWGKSFVVTGAGGYVYSNSFRDFILGGSFSAPGIKQPGTYTVTAYGGPGQTPVSYPFQVTGTACK